MKYFVYQIYLLLAFLMGAALVPAHAQQVPGYKWAWASGGTTAHPYIGGEDVAIDSVSNAYTVGSFSGTAVFEADTLICQSPKYFDMYLAKHNPQGRLLWVRQIAGTQIKSEGSLAVDAQGNIYLAGDLNGAVTIGTSTLSSNKSYYYDTFLAKFTPQGTLLWARQSTSTAWSFVTSSSLVIDRAGNAYLAGNMYGQVQLGQFGFNFNAPLGTPENFLALYSSQGGSPMGQNGLWVH